MKDSVGKGGTMSDSGVYLIPKRLERSYDITFTVTEGPMTRINCAPGPSCL